MRPDLTRIVLDFHLVTRDFLKAIFDQDLNLLSRILPVFQKIMVELTKIIKNEQVLIFSN